MIRLLRKTHETIIYSTPITPHTMNPTDTTGNIVLTGRSTTTNPRHTRNAESSNSTKHEKINEREKN